MTNYIEIMCQHTPPRYPASKHKPRSIYFSLNCVHICLKILALHLTGRHCPAQSQLQVFNKPRERYWLPDTNSTNQISTLDKPKSMSRERRASDKPLRLEYNSSFGFSFKQIIEMIPERRNRKSIGPSKQTSLPFAQKQAHALPYEGSHLMLPVSFP